MFDQVYKKTLCKHCLRTWILLLLRATSGTNDAPGFGHEPICQAVQLSAADFLSLAPVSACCASCDVVTLTNETVVKRNRGVRYTTQFDVLV